MAILKILTYPDERLAKVSEDVTEFDDTLKTLVKDLIGTMHETNGIGLAATQVNVHKRVFVIDIDYKKEEETNAITNKNPKVFINPKITPEGNDQVLFKEACLSVPGIYEEVKRTKNVTIEYCDENGKAHSEKLDDLLAIVVQHENDHLLGKLFIDRLSFVKSNSIKKNFKKSMLL